MKSVSESKDNHLKRIKKKKETNDERKVVTSSKYNIT